METRPAPGSRGRSGCAKRCVIDRGQLPEPPSVREGIRHEREAPVGIDPMSCLRQTSAVTAPAFCSFSLMTICPSVNLDARAMMDGLRLNPEEDQRLRSKRTAFNGGATEPSRVPPSRHGNATLIPLCRRSS